MTAKGVYLENESSNPPKLKLIMPNNTTTHTTTTGLFLHPSLPPSATKAHRVLAFEKSLVSIVKLCDSGYEAKFTKNKVERINPTSTKI